jgi:hypothetical protein
MWVSPWRVYTNKAKTEVLNASDEGAELLCGAWDSIEKTVALRLGLVDEDGKNHSPRSIQAKQTRDAAATEPANKDGDT